MTKTLPYLVTFDGEARSGKGTRVQATKDYLRDVCGYKVMLIDRGQTFRVLVVAAHRAGIDLDNAPEIDAFLNDPANIAECVAFVKEVYHMDKAMREALLYTAEISEASAKIGARPASQVFVRNLTKKWVHDADDEGYEVVLIDGRALEDIANEMDREGLGYYVLGLYFVCDSKVGAMRMLKLIDRDYSKLSNEQQAEVKDMVRQIDERNQRDRERSSEKLIPPAGVKTYRLPDVPPIMQDTRQMAIIDTSAELPGEQRTLPLAKFVADTLSAID